MEHLIQIGVHVNDKEIEANILQAAAKEIIEPMKDEIKKRLISSRSWGSPELTDSAKGIVKEFLNENKERLIELAAKELAEKLARTKAAKEAVGEVAGQMKGSAS